MNLIEAAGDPIVPLRYFVEEAAHRDTQATEALFLTFNADLPFLESRLLDLCRQAGTRVTVVADAKVWSPDVRAITRAGRHYHVGLVAARAAFHPKVSVIAGPSRATAIVGSGNLGIAGWQSNAELATVISATRDAAPLAMEDLRRLLETLPGILNVDPLSTEAIRRTSEQLGELLDGIELTDTGHRIAASWDGPLLDRLPSQPVDDLLLTAPFHDMDSAAVDNLLERLRPRRVRVAVQPDRTVVNPVALHGVLTSYASQSGADCAVIVDGEARYRHGKLIEWSRDGVRTSLTGSPNLSRPALLAQAPEGNFEVAVIGSTRHSLFPAGDPAADPTTLRARSGFVAGSTEGRSGPAVVAAVLRGDVLSLQVARLTTDVDVEISPHSDPDSWSKLTTVPAWTSPIDLRDQFIRGGDRVRLTWTDSSDVRHTSAFLFVTDFNQVLARPIDHARIPKIRNAAPSDLWGDDLSFLESILQELDRLAEQRIDRMPVAPGQTRLPRSGAGRAMRDRAAEPWLWVRDEVVENLGPGIGAYALALPLPTSPTTVTSPDWTDVADLVEESDPDPEVDQGNAHGTKGEDLEGVEEPSQVSTDDSEDPSALRRARQRWARRAAAVAPRLEVQYRLLLLRITLRFWRRGNWDEGDSTPLSLIARMTMALAGPNPLGWPEPPVELTTRAASLAAVALTLMQPRGIRVDAEDWDIYRPLRADTVGLIAAASVGQVEAYLEGLVDLGDLAELLDEAQRLIEDATSGDHLGELERRLRLEDTTESIDRPAINLLHLVVDLPGDRVERLALELLCEIEKFSGVGIWVSNLEREWALAAWAAPDLVRVRGYPAGGMRCGHRRLGPVATPCSIAGEEVRGQKAKLNPLPPQRAAGMLRGMGILSLRPSFRS